MILELRELEDFPARAVLRAAANEIKPSADSVVTVDGAEVSLAIQKSGEEYFCQGTVTAEVVLECARCLKHYESEVHGKTDFVICSEVRTTEEDDVIDDEDYVYPTGTDLRVDITEQVRQAIDLALPLKPLCSEDCQGLCSSCGQNLNEGDCACDGNNVDPRWEGLKGLFPEK